jgi:hypothetical protein
MLSVYHLNDPTVLALENFLVGRIVRYTLELRPGVLITADISWTLVMVLVPTEGQELLGDCRNDAAGEIHIVNECSTVFKGRHMTTVSFNERSMMKLPKSEFVQVLLESPI